MPQILIDKTLDFRSIAARERQRILQLEREKAAALLWLDLRERLFSPLITLLSLLYTVFLPQPLIRALRSNILRARLNELLIRMMDITLATVGLLLSLPLFFLVPILIKLDSPGPVFYHQWRTGIDRRRGERRNADLGIGQERRRRQRRRQDLYGKPFRIYKFRSMYKDAEAESGPVWAAEEDPRVTRIGRYLRKYHIDEIPQFWNILKGDMSMVGPRPERPEIIQKLVAQIPEYRLRLSVRPGLTGLAQILDGYDSSLEDVRKKLNHDLDYIRRRGPLMNCLIIFHTLLYLCKLEKLDHKLQTK